MGFDPISLGAMAVAGTQVAGGAINAYTQRKAAEDVSDIARTNQELYDKRANVMKGEALETESRMRRNANEQIGRARAGTAGSQVASDGSKALKEMDLASRLETEILDQTRKSLYEIDQLKAQGRVSAMEARSRARGYQTGAGVSLLSGFSDAGRTLAKW